jgi:hypothetical protein
MHKYSTIAFIVATVVALAFTHFPKTFQILLLIVVLVLIVAIPPFARLIKKLFTPDRAAEPKASKSLTNAISLKALLLSNLVNILLIILTAGFLLLIGIIIYQNAHTGPFSEADFESTMNGSSLFLILYVLSVLLAPLYSGYLAAYVANRHELLHGGLSQTVTLLFALYEQINGPIYKPHHDWQLVSPLVDNILFCATPFLGAAGGYLRLRSRSAMDKAPRSKS